MTTVVFLERGPWGDVTVSRDPLQFEDGPERFGRLDAAMEGERWVAENPERHRYELVFSRNIWARRPDAAVHTRGHRRRPA
jgi:hypothetical protein